MAHRANPDVVERRKSSLLALRSVFDEALHRLTPRTSFAMRNRGGGHVAALDNFRPHLPSYGHRRSSAILNFDRRRRAFLPGGPMSDRSLNRTDRDSLEGPVDEPLV